MSELMNGIKSKNVCGKYVLNMFSDEIFSSHCLLNSGSDRLCQEWFDTVLYYYKRGRL